MKKEARRELGLKVTANRVLESPPALRVNSCSFVAEKPAFLAVVVLAASALMSACSKEQPKPVFPPAPVSVSDVVQKSMPVQVRAIGNVQPITTVQIKAHVSGEVSKVNFQEGQDVKKGAVLFIIDPRPLEAAVKQAEATLAKDTAAAGQARANMAKDNAQAKNAQVWAEQYEKLNSQGVLAKEQYDTMRTNYEALAATVKADQANIENAEAARDVDKAALQNARVQLGYTTIAAPMDGRLGSLMVHQGSIVKADDTTFMVVINQISPIYATFSVPEQNLPDIKKYMEAARLSVEAVAKDGTTSTTGTLTFVDNQVDQTTGTIQLKATFENRDRGLWPGQFVNVALTLTSQTDAIVAPSQAIQNGQQGQFVFVLKPDNTVETRPVVVARSNENEAVIAKGLTPGEKVVTDGQLRLFQGAKVDVRGAAVSTAGSAALNSGAPGSAASSSAAGENAR
jgi:multidrug efflux system membrane fusion protein